MSSKRKTPARRKTTKARSPLAAPVASAAPNAAPKDHAATAPSAVETPSPDAGLGAAHAASPTVALPPPVSREERHRMIACLAYGYAERAGFRNDPLDNWLRAEREIDARLEQRLAS